MSGIALITKDKGFEARVRAVLGLAGDDAVRRTHPDPRATATAVVADAVDPTTLVVCIGPELGRESIVALARAIDHGYPHVCVLVAAPPSAELWQDAVRLGVRDVVDPATDDGGLRTAFEQLLQTAGRRRVTLLGETTPEPAAGRIVTVLAPKGGCGKTMIATNLAVSLGRTRPEGVAIVDLDLQFGDVASALALQPDHTIHAATRSHEALDATTLKVFLTPHRSNVFALCAPEWPADADDVSAEDAATVVRLLASEFPVVIVDTGGGLDEFALAAAEMSTDLVLPCTTDVASIRAMRRELDVLDRLGMVSQRRHLVLNRADARVGVAASDVAAVLRAEIDVSLASTRAVPVSMNEGSPLVESNPRCPVVRQLQPLVDRFGTAPSAQPASGGFRLRRREVA